MRKKKWKSLLSGPIGWEENWGRGEIDFQTGPMPNFYFSWSALVFFNDIGNTIEKWAEIPN
jgi:hypothetical protein